MNPHYSQSKSTSRRPRYHEALRYQTPPFSVTSDESRSINRISSSSLISSYQPQSESQSLISSDSTRRSSQPQPSLISSSSQPQPSLISSSSQPQPSLISSNVSGSTRRSSQPQPSLISSNEFGSTRRSSQPQPSLISSNESGSTSRSSQLSSSERDSAPSSRQFATNYMTSELYRNLAAPSESIPPPTPHTTANPTFPANNSPDWIDGAVAGIKVADALLHLGGMAAAVTGCTIM